LDKPFFKKPCKPRKIKHSWFPPESRAKINVNTEEITGKAKVRLMTSRIMQLEKQLNESRENAYKSNLKLWHARGSFTSDIGTLSSVKNIIFLLLLTPKLHLPHRKAERWRRMAIISLYSRFKTTYFEKWGIKMYKFWMKRSMDRGETVKYTIQGVDYYKLTPEARRELQRFMEECYDTWKAKGINWKKLDVVE
jgi:hypothetical protein